MVLGHLVATVDRARVVGEGGDPNTMPRVVDGVADDGWVDALTVAEDKAAAVWADDARLAADLRAEGLPVDQVGDALHVRHPSVNHVAAAAARSAFPLRSVARAARSLEDVYLEQAQLTAAAASTSAEASA